MWRLRRSLSDRDALTLMVHGPEFRSGELLVLNPDVFPDVEEHDLVEIVQSERLHPRLVLSVESLAPVRGKVQVSIARDIAAQFGLEPFRGVSVRRVQTQRDVVVAFVELSFKDQFLSRADVWRFKVTMLGHCVYVGRTVECIGIRGQVDAILSPSKTHVLCGVIGDATKIVVRSRSSRLFWLVQMSTEMWEVAPEDGQVYCEKMLHDFLSVQSRKWTESSVSHSVTIMTFSRTFYDVDQFPDGFDPTRAPFVDPRRQGVGPGCGAPGVHVAQGYGPTIHVDPVSGRYYEDFYKVVVMNFTGPDWSRLLLLLKKEFATYYEIHRWRTPEEKSPAHYEICRCPKQANDVDRAAAATTINTGDRECADSEDVYVKWTKLPCGVPSRAKDGNILEAINVTLNVLDKHYMDRDLCRTGQGVVMITAGCSIFDVDSKLAEITEQRMMDSGVGMDMISLSTPPLHVVPLFIYRDGLLAKAATANTWTPSSLHKLSFHKVLGEELMSFEDGSPSHGISSLHSSSLPKTSEWAQAGSTVLRRTLMSAARTTATADRSKDSGEKLTYDVPHWVNLTFLEFSCSCEQASHNYSSAQSPATSNLNQHGPHEKQRGRAWHSSSCQTKRNQRFHPLPSFRMFDITSPSEKLVFPAMLRNLMRGKSKDGPSSGSDTTPTSIQRDEEADWSSDSVNGGVSVFANAIAPIKSLGNQPQLSYTATKLLDPIASTPPLEQLQLSRSPDFDPVLASSQLSTNLSGRLHMRAALTAYDENVFSPVARDSGFAADRPFRDRRLGFATPGINEEHDDVTSVTFANDGRLEWFLRDVRKEAEQRSSTGNLGSYRKGKSVFSGDNDSVVQTLLLPRKLSNNALTVGRADRSVATAPRPLSKDDTSLTCSLEVPLANSIDRSRYGMPLEKRDKDFRPTAHAAAKMNDLQSTFGPSPAVSSPPGSDGFIGRSRSNLRQFSNTGSPLGLRRNQSDFFKAPLVPGSLSFKALLGTQLAHTPVGERKAIINPFSYAKAHGYKRLSSDRQRWSHLFPTSSHGTHRTVDNTFSEAVVHDDEPMFVGPNWTSLTSPAILPLTTDHFPSPQELRQGYSEAFYTLTLPTTAIQTPTVKCVPRYRNHDELLTEMICQRLACDFQLVSSYESPSSIVGSESRPESRQRVYHLSMGHRIHQLIYDAERQTVEVKRFVQREPHDLKVAYTSYTYSLWVGLTQSFQPHQQLFHRYPQPEDNWNALDNLLCGYLDDMADGTKCRRVRFAIVPPLCAKSVGDGDLLTLYASNFTKFIVYLQSRVAPSEFGDYEHIDIRMVLDRPGDTEETEKAMPLTESRMLSFKMACKVSTSTASPSSAPKKKLQDSRTEWVVMRLEETMDVSRCYHLDVRWLACSGVAADDFVGTIRRRAKQVGLDLRRVPEYSSVSRVQIHPLIASVFLPLPVNILETFAVVLTRTLGFVLDDERIADGTGIGYGLSIRNDPTAAKPRVSTRRHRRSASTTARLLLESWRQRGYKQLMHRSVPVFVRIIHDGLIWIPGYDYDRKADGAVSSTAVETLFREIRTTIESQCADCLGYV
uniref:DEP domain-containing protein n=1 Tax=Hyaloperonospora arabidopsidis (strain Emoy2) TaxID=559515 RepID=M4BYI6_HYAAE